MNTLTFGQEFGHCGAGMALMKPPELGRLVLPNNTTQEEAS
jgi:hypothetical protein